MKTQSGLLLSSLLLLTTGACAGDDVAGFTLSASQILAGNKAHEQSTARHGSGSATTPDEAVPPAHADAEQDAQYDMDDVVEAAEATTEGDAATQDVAQDDAGAAQPEQDAGPALADTDAGSAVEVDAATGAGDDSETDSGLRLIDGQIAAVLSAANRAIIAQAELVRGGSDTDPEDEIAALAGELSAQHAAAQARQQAIVTQKRITSKETALSSQLNQDASTRLAALNAADECDRGQAYLSQLIESHTQLIALFEAVLMPSVCDGELKSELNQAYEALKAELARAKLVGAATE